MKTTFILLMVLSISYARAQSDTIIVCYEEAEFNSSDLYRKLDNDPIPETLFPFNGGASYRYSKRIGETKIDFRFHFLSWSLDGPWPYFDYKIIDRKEISEIYCVDNGWFQKNSYIEIVKTFTKNDPVIFLLDERYFKSDSVYLVRVLFTYDAGE